MKVLNKIFLLSFAAIAFSCATQKKAANTLDPDQENSELSYKDERQAESLFLTGMKYYMLEDFDKAMTYFKKSHEIHPNSAGTNFQIAQLYIGSGYPLEALPFAEKAYLLNKENIYYYQILAKCYSQVAENATTDKERKSYLKKSANTYEALISKYPTETDVYFELANLYLQQGDVDQGIKAINKIEEKYGINEEISMQKQQIYLHINQLDKAVLEGEKLIDAFPNQPEYKVSLAKLYFSNDKPKEAKEILEKLNSENDLNGEGKVMLSDLYWADGEKDKSNGMLISAFEDPSYDFNQKVNISVGFINSNSNRLNDIQLDKITSALIEVHPLEAKSYVVYGDLLLKRENKKEARTQYLKALKIDESFYQVWQNVIVLDSDLDETDSIISHTNKALEIFPNQGIFWYYNASGYLIKKDYKKAVYSFEKSKVLSADNGALLNIINAQLGDTYNGMKDYEKSDASYEEVLLVEPNNTHVLNNYSYFLSLRNDKLEKAVQMCEKLMALESENSTYLDTYAWVLYKQKKYDKAKELLERALISSDDGTVIEHYGDVLYQLNDIENAVLQWERSKKTGDYSEFLDKKLQDKKLYE